MAFVAPLPAAQAQSAQLATTNVQIRAQVQIAGARTRITPSSVSFHSSVSSGVQFMTRRWAAKNAVARMSTPVAETPEAPAESSNAGPKKQRERNVTHPLSSLSKGQEVTGKVVAVQPYGAFIDIGSEVDGLLHISQISTEFVKSVEDLVKVGDEITAFVKEIDVENKKVALTKMTEADLEARTQAKKAPRAKRAPRDTSGKTKLADLVAGAEIAGKVASISEFGAFVDIGAVKDGLLHISEVSAERIEKIEDALQLGQEVTVRVVNVDLEKSKISLTMLSEEQRSNRPRGERKPRGERAQPANPFQRIRTPGQEAAAKANAENAPKERRQRRRDDDDEFDMPKNTGPKGDFNDAVEGDLTPLQLAMLKAQGKA